jgi:hypothetical protein
MLNRHFFALIKSFSVFSSFTIFVLVSFEIVLIDKLRKYKTEKFSRSSLNHFTKAKNLVLLILKYFKRTSFSTFLDIVPSGL